MDERGFTLVELLIVMLILAILAGLAIATFLGQSVKARDAEAKQAVAVARTAIELVGEENGGYDGITVDDLVAEEPALADATLSDIASAEREYAIQVTSSSGATFSVRREGGSFEFDCAPREVGGCPLDGNWSH
jgi:type IV pilus assembly protein PilA